MENELEKLEIKKNYDCIGQIFLINNVYDECVFSSKFSIYLVPLSKIKVTKYPKTSLKPVISHILAPWLGDLSEHPGLGKINSNCMSPF